MPNLIPLFIHLLHYYVIIIIVSYPQHTHRLPLRPMWSEVVATHFAHQHQHHRLAERDKKICTHVSLLLPWPKSHDENRIVMSHFFSLSLLQQSSRLGRKWNQIRSKEWIITEPRCCFFRFKNHEWVVFSLAGLDRGGWLGVRFYTLDFILLH